MSNSQQSFFSMAVREATYLDLTHLRNLFQYADSSVVYWSLMQPDNLRQIIIGTEQRLLKICLQCMMQRSDSSIKPDSKIVNFSSKSSFLLMSEVKKFISGDLSLIGKEFSQYEYSYQLFANFRQKYENDLLGVSDEQAAPDRVVVGAFPRPTLLAVACNSAIDIDTAKQDLERRSQQLNKHFAETLQKTVLHLDGMQHRTLQAIASYADRLG
jgi:hypothetical protein